MKTLFACAVATLFAVPAMAEDKPAMPDMTKMGPMSRKVAKEDKKGIDALYAAADASMKKGDVNAMADLVDFPVMMVTDDSKGAESHTEYNHEQFVAMMAPFFANGQPKGTTITHKHSPRFLSETLAMVDEDTAMTNGKTKGGWKSESMVVQKDGKWKFKGMFEAGWGDMGKAQAAAAPAPAAPAAAPAKPAPAAPAAAPAKPAGAK